MAYQKTLEKIEFIKQLLAENPDLSISDAGKQVAGKMGMLRYKVLREAFVAAGGKVRPRRTSVKKAAPAAQAGGPQLTVANNPRRQFVVDLLKAKPELTLTEVDKHVRKKFNPAIGFEALKSLFVAAGGKLTPINPTAAASAPARVSFPNRGQGRRLADRNSARVTGAVGGMPQHMIVVRTGDGVDARDFTSENEARQYAQDQVSSGVGLDSIAYYTRNKISIEVDV